MAYDGTYLARVRDIGPFGNGFWDYHTTDALATVTASGYFSDAAFSDGTTASHGKKGLRKGDLIRVFTWASIPDEVQDLFKAAATAPALSPMCLLRVTGIVQATGVATTGPAEFLEGSATYDAASLIDGAGATTTVTVTGAALGDYVVGVSHGVDLAGITVTGYVSAADTVSVRFQNESGGTLDLASATLRALVRKASI